MGTTCPIPAAHRCPHTVTVVRSSLRKARVQLREQHTKTCWHIVWEQPRLVWGTPPCSASCQPPVRTPASFAFTLLLRVVFRQAYELTPSSRYRCPHYLAISRCLYLCTTLDAASGSTAAPICVPTRFMTRHLCSHSCARPCTRPVLHRPTKGNHQNLLDPSTLRRHAHLWIKRGTISSLCFSKPRVPSSYPTTRGLLGPHIQVSSNKFHARPLAPAGPYVSRQSGSSGPPLCLGSAA